MRRKPWSLRLALWVAACAMVLQGAMPLLAKVSADMQGKNLVEVCTVYGVATVELDDEGRPLPTSSHGNGGAHCALSALLAFAPPPVPAVLAVVSVRATAPAEAQRVDGPAFDASARWIAGLKHGPPSVS